MLWVCFPILGNVQIDFMRLEELDELDFMSSPSKHCIMHQSQRFLLLTQGKDDTGKGKGKGKDPAQAEMCGATF